MDEGSFFVGGTDMFGHQLQFGVGDVFDEFFFGQHGFGDWEMAECDVGFPGIGIFAGVEDADEKLLFVQLSHTPVGKRPSGSLS